MISEEVFPGVWAIGQRREGTLANLRYQAKALGGRRKVGRFDTAQHMSHTSECLIQGQTFAQGDVNS